MKRLDYDPEMPDDQLDLSWSEWRHLVAGTLVVIAFILFVTLVAGGS